MTFREVKSSLPELVSCPAGAPAPSCGCPAAGTFADAWFAERRGQFARQRCGSSTPQPNFLNRVVTAFSKYEPCPPAGRSNVLPQICQVDLTPYAARNLLRLCRWQAGVVVEV